MKESLHNVKNELRRADHLIFVSLKYTRTVDVLRSVINRLINALDIMIDMSLLQLKEQGKIDELPKLPGVKCEVLKKHFSKKEKAMECIDFYLLLRKIMRSKFSKSNEFRRHVTMTVILTDNKTGEEEKMHIEIDEVKEFYEKTKLCMAKVKEFTIGEEEE